MNSKNEIMAKLKELFELTKKVKFADTKLQDGSIIRTEGDIVMGTKVSLISEDGSITDVPDGDHTLEDGSIITVKSGVIDAIKPAAAPALDTPVDAAVNVKAPETEIKTDLPTQTAPAAPAANPATEPDADEPAEGFDWNMIAEILTDLANRVGALESAAGVAKMEMEAFKKAPAATPVTFKGKTLMEVIKEENKANASKSKELSFAEKFAKLKPAAKKETSPRSNYDFGAEAQNGVAEFGRQTGVKTKNVDFGSGLKGGMEITND